MVEKPNHSKQFASSSEKAQKSFVPNVGIGTSTPQEKLTVNNGKIWIGGSTQPELQIVGDSGANSTAYVNFFGRQTGANGQISAFGFYNWNGGAQNVATIEAVRGAGGNNEADLNFATRAQADGSVTSRMRITGGGSVGIGTANPVGLLEISSGNSGDAKVFITADADNSDENDNPYLIFQQDGGFQTGAIWINEDGGGDNNLNISASDATTKGILFRTNNVDNGFEVAPIRMSINPGGSVGIGTTAPAALLDISRATTTGNSIIDALRIAHTDSNSGGASGIGARITFIGETATDGQFPEIGKIESVLDDATNASRDSSLRFFTLGPNTSAGTASLKLTVGSGSVTVSSASFSAIAESVQNSVNSGASLTLGSLSAGNIYRVTLTADATITLPVDPGITNGVANIVVILTQDGTGSRAVTFTSPSGSVLWDQGLTPTVCSTASSKSIFQFMKINGDNNYYGSLSWKACP